MPSRSARPVVSSSWLVVVVVVGLGSLLLFLRARGGESDQGDDCRGSGDGRNATSRTTCRHGFPIFPPIAVEPLTMRFVGQNLIRYAKNSSGDYAAGEAAMESSTALPTLDGVGGGVFTRRIEHIFE